MAPAIKGYRDTLPKVRREDLVLVKEGRELRNRGECYHINQAFPEVIQVILLTKIHESSKQQIIKWIHEQKIYIRGDSSNDNATTGQSG